MAVSKTLQEFLQAARVKYTAARHSVAYTAQEIAASQHVSGKQLAKSVLVKTNQGPVLAVLPATHLIDFARLKAALRATSLSIAKEADIKAQFPDVEVGAMSPFGNLYHVPVVADRMLAEVGDIVFNAGSHTDTIRLAYRDFVALAKPAVASFAKSRDKAKPKAKPKARKAKKPARKPA
ncbi:MAG: YbaK/EbsC family protein, partial [Candidatus Omnitrophica bacterium]|nr:YbaK/EbsC family protein [Candidatus Omnitrophota bacterium]